MREFIRWQVEAAYDYMRRGGLLGEWLRSKDFAPRDMKQIIEGVREKLLERERREAVSV